MPWVLIAAFASFGCLRAAKGTDTTTPDETVAPLQEKELTKVVPTDEPSATFLVDGKPMCFAGSNNYYLIWKSEVMIDSVFQNCKKMGLTVLISAVAFSLLHFEPRRLLVLLAIGIVLGVVRWRTRSLGAAIVAHGVNNLPGALGIVALAAGADAAG